MSISHRVSMFFLQTDFVRIKNKVSVDGKKMFIIWLPDISQRHENTVQIVGMLYAT